MLSEQGVPIHDVLSRLERRKSVPLFASALNDPLGDELFPHLEQELFGSDLYPSDPHRAQRSFKMKSVDEVVATKTNVLIAQLSDAPDSGTIDAEVSQLDGELTQIGTVLRKTADENGIERRDVNIHLENRKQTSGSYTAYELELKSAIESHESRLNTHGWILGRTSKEGSYELVVKTGENTYQTYDFNQLIEKQLSFARRL